jgi:hypothetical protein
MPTEKINHGFGTGGERGVSEKEERAALAASILVSTVSAI